VKPKVLEKWIWILIYAGLLCLVAGLAVSKRQEDVGQAMALAGGIVAALGAVLIVVRARMKV
jgi:hypothetical protein